MGILHSAGGTLRVESSLIAENEAARGGGTLIVVNSTISGNKAVVRGGKIRSDHANHRVTPRGHPGTSSAGSRLSLVPARMPVAGHICGRCRPVDR